MSGERQGRGREEAEERQGRGREEAGERQGRGRGECGGDWRYVTNLKCRMRHRGQRVGCSPLFSTTWL